MGNYACLNYASKWVIYVCPWTRYILLLNGINMQNKLCDMVWLPRPGLKPREVIQVMFCQGQLGSVSFTIECAVRVFDHPVFGMHGAYVKSIELLTIFIYLLLSVIIWSALIWKILHKESSRNHTKGLLISIANVVHTHMAGGSSCVHDFFR